MEQEKNREGLNMSKTVYFLKSLFGHTRKIDAYLEHFTDFDPEALQESTRKVIKAVLLDVDACIAPIYEDILPENIEKIKELIAEGIKVGVYSNCKSLERLQVLRDLGIRIYDGNVPKPGKEGFLDVCERLDFEPETTWMIGDNPSTDGGAIDAIGGMALVKPIPDGDLTQLPFKKKLLIKTRNALRSVVRFSTLAGNDHIVRLPRN